MDQLRQLRDEFIVDSTRSSYANAIVSFLLYLYNRATTKHILITEVDGHRVRSKMFINIMVMLESSVLVG
jgi:hypothetical protein